MTSDLSTIVLQIMANPARKRRASDDSERSNHAQKPDLTLSPTPKRVRKPGPENVATILKGRAPKRANATPCKKSTTSNDPSKSRMVDLVKRGADGLKGVDVSLPPLSRIEEIFQDLTKNALSLGLKESLAQLKHSNTTIRVATMCSGSESPLVAIRMIQDSLINMGYSAHDCLPIEHVFSAEIEPFKQAYIERNFKPQVVFRDVTELARVIGTDNPVATDVYGATVPLTKDIDMLVVGTSCVDLSLLNNHRKGLSGGESGDTWAAVLKFCSEVRPSVVLLENVKTAPWAEMIRQYEAIGYETGGVHVDTKNYYLPQTRQRGYMACFDARGRTASGCIADAWVTQMGDLRRNASAPVSSFLLPAYKLREHGRDTEPDRKVDWQKCRVRHQIYREEKGLGMLRPVTQWQECGTRLPPDHGAREFFQTQVPRVLDMIDTLQLRHAQDKHPYDSLYKMRIWDLSQNLDRDEDNKAFGICGCITPTGIFYASELCRLLSADELLGLQGFPLGSLSFTTESPSEIKDLAGNAMSTTVVGAAILAAINAASSKGLLNPSDNKRSSLTLFQGPEIPQIFEILKREKIAFSSWTALSSMEINSMLTRARAAMRRCSCERGLMNSKANVQTCSDCGQSTCQNCGGNPRHRYRHDAKPMPRQSPWMFKAWLQSILPLRLYFRPECDKNKLPGTLPMDSYGSTIRSSIKETFRFNEVRRVRDWTVVYASENARLEFVISERSAEWRLYVSCPKDEPGNSDLRSSLIEPVAKCQITHDLWSNDWQSRHSSTSSKIRIGRSGEARPSWGNDLGLVGCRKQYVPHRIRISSSNDGIGMSIAGLYEHLPHCGKACNSLFKRKTGSTAETQLYLFLDPTSTREPQHDSFVIAEDISRLDLHEVRSTICTLDPAWKPWPYNEPDQPEEVTVHHHQWVSFDHVLNVRDSRYEVEKPSKEELAQATSGMSCTDAVQLLHCKTSEQTSKVSILLPSDGKFIRKHSDLFEAMRRCLLGQDWIPLNFSSTRRTLRCEKCAPLTPKIVWALDLKDKLVAFDDTKAATDYERAIKARPPPIFFRSTGSQIEVCLSAISLGHRAAGLLPPNLHNISVSWRFVENERAVSAGARRKYHLPETVGNSAPAVSLGSIDLFPKQCLSLSWMMAQEQGVEFKLEGFVEESISSLGWSAEARAEGYTTVRGGICADHPGFGKTITSLALINSDISDPRSSVCMSSPDSQIANGFLPSKATLIVSPAHLIKQWLQEISTHFNMRSTKVIRIKAVTDLSKFTIRDFEDARIILVNRRLFANDSYLSRLAAFAAAPIPSTESSHALHTWLQFVSQQIPNHVEVLKGKGQACLLKVIHEKFQTHIRSDSFNAAIPSKRSRGAQYTSKSNSAATHLSQSFPALDTKYIKHPLFEMFSFNRIIVDEFHEGDAKEMVLINGLRAHKRWGLSATPALDDTRDVALMAELLGVELRYGSMGQGCMKRQSRTTLRKNMSREQVFHSMRVVTSKTVHLKVEEHAQSFLDTFVRQNVMDFEKPFEEHLVPVTLELEHRASYAKLSARLISQRMHTRIGDIDTNDRHDPHNEDGTGGTYTTDTAEETLSKLAASKKPASLHDIVKSCEANYEALARSLVTKIKLAQDHESDEFVKWLSFLKSTIGDSEVWDFISSHAQVSHEIENANDGSYISSGVEYDSDEHESKPAKGRRDHTALVDDLCVKLTDAKRSARYYEKVRRMTKECGPNGQTMAPCNGSACDEAIVSKNDCAVSTKCGHIICRHCFELAQRDITAVCPCEGCSASIDETQVLWLKKLHHLQPSAPGTHGAKINAVVKILQNIRSKGEQAVIFAQFESEMREMKRAMRDEAIPVLVVTGENSSTELERFKTSSPDEFAAIVLNTSDQTASGSNLQMANHVIFLSPLLKATQYEYSATMAQAIGRVRRHGQARDIHVHRIVALDTIDIDILEQRERRAFPLFEAGHGNKSQNDLHVNAQGIPAKLERMQFIQDNSGKFSLHPMSWLVKQRVDPDDVDDLGFDATVALAQRSATGRVPGYQNFTTLPRFSDAYNDEDE